MELKEPLIPRVMKSLVARRDRLLVACEKYGGRAYRFIRGASRGIWSSYRRRIWNRFARNAEGSLTWVRAGLTTLATILFVWAIPTMVHAVWQTALLATTFRESQVFLTSHEEIDPFGEVHSAYGCGKYPCDDGDALYFRAESTVVNTLYALFTRGSAYYAEEIVGVISPGVNACTVRSYGFRIKMLIRRGIYPTILYAVCEPWAEPVRGPGSAAEP